MSRSTPTPSITRRLPIACGLILAVLLATCMTPVIGRVSTPAQAAIEANRSWAVGPAHITIKPGKKLMIGFIYVGAHNDFGYNQAADIGRLAMQKNLASQVTTIYQENVPETPNVERVMEQMISEGAQVIFATSFGYLQFALDIAPKYPNVIFLHQGGEQDNSTNVGTYFGDIWQAVYAAGVAAGKMTKSNKLGFVGAFPIPQLLLNVNAFELGAQSVNPKAITTVVFTQAWCDPAKLADAANSLLDQGVDVITQHQDCTEPVIRATISRHAWVVGYHADASAVAGKYWITGSVWTWGALYTSMVKQIIAGTWKPSIYRIGLKDRVVAVAPFGPAVPASVKALVLKTEQAVSSGALVPFKGPIIDQNGKVQIKAGVIPTVPSLETMNYLVKGVVGTMPH